MAEAFRQKTLNRVLRAGARAAGRPEKGTDGSHTNYRTLSENRTRGALEVRAYFGDRKGRWPTR